MLYFPLRYLDLIDHFKNPMCTYIVNDDLTIAGRQFSSRLMLGTGKYKNFQE